MIRITLMLSVVVCLCIANPTLAQTKQIQKEVEDKLRQRRLYEDMEIMRRLLQRSLLSPYGAHGELSHSHPWVHDLGVGSGGVTVGGSADDLNRHFLRSALKGRGDSAAAHSSLEMEGTYLRGRGVIYTMTLPLPAHDPRPEPIQPAAKPVSEWERLRRELRGEKVEPGSDSPARKERPLADVALRVLAEYGHHLTHLPENEQITLAVTFRGQSCAACHAGGGAVGGEMIGPSALVPHNAGRSGGLIGSSAGASDLGTGGLIGIGGTSEASVPSVGGGAGLPGGAGGLDAPQSTGLQFVQRLRAQVNDHVLLGDLHLKQGRHHEAVKAFEEAATQYGEVVRTFPLFAGIPTQDQLRSYLSGAELFGKLAQARLALNDNDGALAALKRAAEATRKAEQLAQTAQPSTGKPAPKAAGTRAIPLASKLIISAPKKVLDQMGTGKMSFEDFKKAVTVEYLTFGPTEAAGAATGGGDGAGPLKP